MENVSVPTLQTAGFWARRASGAIGPGDEKSHVLVWEILIKNRLHNRKNNNNQ